MASAEHHLRLEAGEDRPSKLTASLPLIGESLVVIIILLMFSEALLGPLLADPTRPDDSPIMRVIWFPFYGLIFALGMMRFLPLANLAIRMPLIILLMGVIAASATWSIDQGLTIRRFIAIGMTTTFGLYIAMRYNWREMLTLFGIVWFILCIGTIIISLGVPSLGVDSDVHVGAWKGLWFEKNTLGGHMSRASFLFGFLVLTQPEKRKFWGFGLLMSIVLVVLSQSATSLLGMLIGFLVLAAGWFMRRGPVSSLTAFWVMVTLTSAFIGILLTDPDLLFGLIGRDATLTGRTDIWEILLNLIEERPNRGYGYGAFWSPGSDQALYVRELTQWEVPTAHNGWLETWLSIGLVGLSLFCVSFVLTIIRAVMTAFSRWVGFFALGFILQFFVFSLSESIILQQNSITWVTYVAIAAALVHQNLGRDPIKLLGPRRNRDFVLPD